MIPAFFVLFFFLKHYSWQAVFHLQYDGGDTVPQKTFCDQTKLTVMSSDTVKKNSNPNFLSVHHFPNILSLGQYAVEQV